MVSVADVPDAELDFFDVPEPEHGVGLIVADNASVPGVPAALLADAEPAEVLSSYH